MLTYNVLNGIYQHNYDIDYLFLGEYTQCRDDRFIRVLKCGTQEDNRKIYRMMITGFVELWDWNFDILWEKCLYSELKALNLLLMNHDSLDRKLFYLRETNNLSQQAFAEALGVGRTKCGKCESGRKNIDLDSIINMYNGGFSLPSFYFEEYPGIVAIANLLERNTEKKNRYTQYLSNILTNIVKNDEALRILQSDGVI